MVATSLCTWDFSARPGPRARLKRTVKEGDDRMTKILVIDDDSRIRLMVSHVLGCVGHVVVAAKDGGEGVRLFREERPALVITEMLMPNGEGLDTIRRIRDQAALVPIIAMSGAWPTRMVLDVTRKVGADAAIEKPFSDAQLVAAVYNLLFTAKRVAPGACRSTPPLARDANAHV
jgi:DNA-binding response OmpR family regulator